MSEFDPSRINQRLLHDLRRAAEQAWGDDTRHEHHQGHPQPSKGQCYVTSRWLTTKLGGHVGIKDGHYFWVSPDKRYIIDLTGDLFAYKPADLKYQGIKLDSEDPGWEPVEDQKRHLPGPILFKRSDHPLYKGFRVKSNDDHSDRVEIFNQRADEAYDRA